MQTYLKIILIILLIGIIALVWRYRKTLLLVYRSIKAFDEKNLARSFQTMYKIQPSTKILKSATVSPFEYHMMPMIETFHFRGTELSTEKFLKETKTSAMLVIAHDQIVYENYS